MKNFLIIASAIFIAVSCEKKLDQSIDTKSSADKIANLENGNPVEPSTEQTCYLGVIGKDSVFISLDDNLGTFTGKMRYKNSQKDSSMGDLLGSKNGDTLKLNYIFASEGVTSDREIYFLLKDKNLIEGIGEHKVEDNKDIYTNPAKLKYDGEPLKLVDCKNFEKNFISK